MEERTFNLGREVIFLAKKIKMDIVNQSVVNQLVRSATSIGANYMEADCAESKKDFKHKISICKKESKETTYWLRVLETANPEKKELCHSLRKEAHELTLIFSSIVNKI
ncbi:MAG: four helix bundle protein [Candidatus Colwellbacteria bacterium]|nr:four helix bundle protein [Candidatus Colwellbacteria bacterium]